MFVMTALTANFIIEILGRPAEHLQTTLGELVDRIGADKGVAILRKEIHKPKPVEKADNLWTTFAEVELRFETLPLFFNAVMTYLPAHIEVVEPESFKFNTFELNEFTNFIVGRLHNYDALAKRIMGERDILINKLEYLRKGGKIEKVFEKQQPQAPRPMQKIKASKNKKKNDNKMKKKK